MALDEYLLRLAEQDRIMGALRFYTWRPYSISIGKFLRVKDLNLIKIRKDHISLVRRITGGNAIFHKNDLSYSFIIRKELFGITNKKELYIFLADIFVESLMKLGIEAKMNLVPSIYKNSPDCFSSVSQYEIVDRYGDKMIASAQKIGRNAFLQHGSLYHSVNNNLTPYLKTKEAIGEETTKMENGEKSIFKVKQFANFIDEVKKRLSEKIRLIKYIPRNVDMRQINLLICEKYSTDEWNLCR